MSKKYIKWLYFLLYREFLNSENLLVICHYRLFCPAKDWLLLSLSRIFFKAIFFLNISKLWRGKSRLMQLLGWQSVMAVRGLSVITVKAAASLPIVNGADWNEVSNHRFAWSVVNKRQSSGMSLLNHLSMTCRKNCASERSRASTIFTAYVMFAFGFPLP